MISWVLVGEKTKRNIPRPCYDTWDYSLEFSGFLYLFCLDKNLGQSTSFTRKLCLHIWVQRLHLEWYFRLPVMGSIKKDHSIRSFLESLGIMHSSFLRYIGIDWRSRTYCLDSLPSSSNKIKLRIKKTQQTETVCCVSLGWIILLNCFLTARVCSRLIMRLYVFSGQLWAIQW